MHYLPDIFLSPTGDLVAGFLRRVAVGYLFFVFHVSSLRHENTKKTNNIRCSSSKPCATL